MKKEAYKGDYYSLAYYPYSAKEFVYQHRNIFADSVRRYIESSYPVVIKEISRHDNEVTYWYWVFFRDKRFIYMFDHKPTEKELKEMWQDINKEYKERKEKGLI